MSKTNLFDDFAAEYDKWFDEHENEYQQELKALKEFLPTNGKGLEIGAGTGRFSLPLKISLAIEPSAAMRNIARMRGVNVIAGAAESLPLDNGLFDFALLVTTVCFLESPRAAFLEAHRILRAGGVIVVGLIDKESKLGRKYEEKKNISRFYKEAKFHSVKEVKKELIMAGFTDIDSIQAILPDDTSDYQQLVKKGYGEGSFVVLRARKPLTG